MIDDWTKYGYNIYLANHIESQNSGFVSVFDFATQVQGISNTKIITSVMTGSEFQTSLGVGDGSATSAGILINTDGFYACEASQLLANANVRILANGSVYITGIITAEAGGTIGGFTIGSTDLSVTSGGNTTTLSSGATAFSAGPTGAPTVTITRAGVISGTEGSFSGNLTIGGRLATTIGGAINADGDFVNDVINTNLDTSAKNILGSFTFGVSGAIAMATDDDNGVWVSPTGILGKKLGANTFAIDTSGNVTVAGVVTMATGYIGGTSGWVVSANSINTSSATNNIRGVSTGLLSDDTGFFIQGDGKVRFGEADGSALVQGVYNDGTDVLIKSKDNKIFFKDPNSLIDYQIGAGNNLLKDHGMETLLNPRQNTINAVGVTPVIARYCLTQETTKKLDNTTGSITKMAQSFTWNGDADDFCSGVWLKLQRTQIIMLGGNFTMRLETDNAGSPSGVLANANGTVAIDERYVGGTTFNDPECVFYFPFPTGFTLTNGTRYWAVWSAAGLSGTDYFNFKHDNASDSYADGSSKYYDGSWNAYTGDFYFGIQAWTNDTTGWVENVYNNISDLFNQEWDITNGTRPLQPDYNQLNVRVKPNWYTEGFPYIKRLIFGGTDASVLTGLQSVVVDNLSYVYQIACMNVTASKAYTFSANIGTEGDNNNTNAASISAVLKIEAFSTNGAGSLTSLGSTTETTLITSSFSAATDDLKVIRAKCNYTLPATTTFVKISVYSASTEKIRTDAWKLEQASYPSAYNEESSLWRHAQGRGMGNEHTDSSIALNMLASGGMMYRGKATRSVGTAAKSTGPAWAYVNDDTNAAALTLTIEKQFSDSYIMVMYGVATYCSAGAENIYATPYYDDVQDTTSEIHTAYPQNGVNASSGLDVKTGLSAGTHTIKLGVASSGGSAFFHTSAHITAFEIRV